MTGLRVKPRLGDALFWFNTIPRGNQPDELSQHAGEPVVKGTKWSVTRWFRTYAIV